MRGNSSRPFAVRADLGAPTPDLVRALRDRASREATGLFAVEGIRFLTAAVDAASPVHGLLVCPRLLTNPLGIALVRRLRASGIPATEVDAATFHDLSHAPEAQGVIALLPLRWETHPKTVGRHDLWIGVDTIRTPGNVGTLLRAAEAAGATGLMVFDPRATGPDPHDPVVVRATMGSLFALRLVRTCHTAFRKWPLRYELTVVGATGEASKDYRAVTYRRPTVFMLGDERAGLSDAQRLTCDATVRIPMHGRADSLNVAMAGTILLFEARNQRHPVRR
ncbi:MAG: TrmH family RNA methyltransferase [Fimbriimonas sp.]